MCVTLQVLEENLRARGIATRLVGERLEVLARGNRLIWVYLIGDSVCMASRINLTSGDRILELSDPDFFEQFEQVTHSW